MTISKAKRPARNARPTRAQRPLDLDEVRREVTTFLRGVVNDPKATDGRRQRAATAIIRMMTGTTRVMQPRGKKAERDRVSKETVAGDSAWAALLRAPTRRQ